MTWRGAAGEGSARCVGRREREEGFYRDYRPVTRRRLRLVRAKFVAAGDVDRLVDAPAGPAWTLIAARVIVKAEARSGSRGRSRFGGRLDAAALRAKPVVDAVAYGCTWAGGDRTGSCPVTRFDPESCRLAALLGFPLGRALKCGGSPNL